GRRDARPCPHPARPRLRHPAGLRLRAADERRGAFGVPRRRVVAPARPGGRAFQSCGARAASRRPRQALTEAGSLLVFARVFRASGACMAHGAAPSCAVDSPGPATGPGKRGIDAAGHPLIPMIVAGLVLAFVFGAIANRLKMPPLVGYLIAGIAVAPYTPGLVADAEIAHEFAEIGVILLMFG